MKFYEFLNQLRDEINSFQELWEKECPNVEEVDMHWKSWVEEFEIGLKGEDKESYIDQF